MRWKENLLQMIMDSVFHKSKRFFFSELLRWNETDEDSEDWSFPCDFAHDCLRSHNHFRAQHGCPPLHLASEISTFSQQWARHLAQEDSLHHSHHSLYGENLFAVYSSGRLPKVTGDQVVESWYSEHALFPSFASVPAREVLARAGHFTQVVWSKSRNLGVGQAVSKSNRLYVVANYYPAGNVLGALSDNVPRRIFRASRCYRERQVSRRTACLWTHER